MPVTDVPTLSLAALRASAHDPSAASAAHAALDRACQEHGFFLLTGHGLDAPFAAMWDASAAFFTGDAQNKHAIYRTAEQPLGYYDRELTKRQRDLKEVFDFTQPREAGERDPNQWPAQPANFQQAMATFYESTGALALELLALLGQTLAYGVARERGANDAAALAASPFEMPPGSPRTSNVRLNYYPTTDPLGVADRAQTASLGDMALHHHTDPGLITLLLQDDVGGLQTRTRSGEWIDVPANPQAVVINLGDALQVVSNDRYCAAVHRVLPMGTRARYSTPYFLNPPPDAVLAPLEALAGSSPCYRPIPWKQYIQARIDDNFADLGEDDTQISHYRIASG